jgi:hypothetical protein
MRIESGKLCALAAALEYNDDEFYFCDARAEDTLSKGEWKFAMSYACENGVVKFILDGVKNAQSGEILARFYFRARREGAFTLEFSMRGLSSICATAFDIDGNVKPITVDFSHTSGWIITASDAKKPIEIKKPALIRASIEWEGETDRAGLVLPIRADGKCIAVGLKVFVLAMMSGEYEIYYLAAQVETPPLISRDTAMRFCIPVAVNGRICAVVTPLIYHGNAVIEGKKEFLIIDNGAIYK